MNKNVDISPLLNKHIYQIISEEFFKQLFDIIKNISTLYNNGIGNFVLKQGILNKTISNEFINDQTNNIHHKLFQYSLEDSCNFHIISYLVERKYIELNHKLLSKDNISVFWLLKYFYLAI